MSIPLMIVGGITFFGSLIYALVNIANFASKFLANKNTLDHSFELFWPMFKRHIWSVIVAIVGMALVFVGILLQIAQ